MLIKRDLRRLIISTESIIGVILISAFGLFLSFLISSGTKFGISVFGDLTIFSNGKLILVNGLNYAKGIGIIVAVLISLFIGKEYRYKTFGYLLSKDISRKKIYLSKLLSSIFTGISIFMIYEIISYVVLSFGNNVGVSSREFGILLLQGILIYSSFSSIICFISVAFKNYIMSLILSVSFIVLEANMILGLEKIFSFFKMDDFFYELSRYSLYGIKEVESAGNFNLTKEVLIGTIILMLLSTTIGIFSFCRKEV